MSPSTRRSLGDFLGDINRNLRRRLDRMIVLLERPCLGLLRPYLDTVRCIAKEYQDSVSRSLRDLNTGDESCWSTLLIETQRCTATTDALDSAWMSCLVRSQREDCLALEVIAWLHQSRMETRDIPFAVADGSFSVLPVRFDLLVEDRSVILALYELPFTHQHGLLYLPLFGHEYGHVLYTCYTKSLQQPTEDFEEEVRVEVGGTAQQSLNATQQNEVDAWNAWLQEYYCDAVGLRLFGPAFLRAFSRYFLPRPRERRVGPLTRRSHPLTEMRIRLLLRAAAAMNDPQGAWRRAIADVTEDWTLVLGSEPFRLEPRQQNLQEPLWLALNELLRITAVKEYEAEGDAKPSWPSRLNQAWERQLNEPGSYWNWERLEITGLTEASV
jgi:hypothetical protein